MSLLILYHIFSSLDAIYNFLIQVKTTKKKKFSYIAYIEMREIKVA